MINKLCASKGWTRWRLQGMPEGIVAWRDVGWECMGWGCKSHFETMCGAWHVMKSRCSSAMNVALVKAYNHEVHSVRTYVTVLQKLL